MRRQWPRTLVPMATDPELVARFETMEREECLRLLANCSVGRIGFLVDDRPEILPVNYALDGEDVVFRTAEGTVLNRASLAAVAFEIDHADESDQSGWSVLVQGTARDIGEAIDPTSERLRRLTLVSWAPGTRQRWFQVSPEKISGRRIRMVPAGD